MTNNERSRVLVIGELNVDLIVTGLDEMPMLGQELICGGFERVMGSSSAIFAVKLAHLGPEVDFVGLIGDDDDGRFVLEQLRINQVGIRSVLCRRNVRTGVTISLSFSTDRALVTYPGAMAELTIDDIDLALLPKYDHLHVASYFLQKGLQPGLATLFRRAKQAGLTVSLDTGWDPHAEWGQELYDLLQDVDAFLPNQDEARALAGTADELAALTTLSKMARRVIIKLGREGAITLSDKGKPLHVSGFPAQVVDTTGAGDSFDAGFVYGCLCRGWTLPAAIRFANACGALAVSSVGGATEAPSAQEVQAFIDRTNGQSPQGALQQPPAR